MENLTGGTPPVRYLPCVVPCKLYFTQIKIYEAANCTDGSLVVIFYFTEEEKRFAEKVIEDSGYKSAIDESIFLIDCRKDNKKSASIA